MSEPARVTFRFQGPLRRPSGHGVALKLGSAKCRSTSPCLVKVDANLLGRVKQGSRSRRRSLVIPETRLRLAPGASGPTSVKIPRAANQLSKHPGTQLVAHLHWSTATAHGWRRRSIRISG